MKLKKFNYDTSGMVAVVNDQSLELLVRSFFEGKTGANFAKQTGIKSTDDLHYMDSDLYFQADADCAFTPSGSTTFSKRTITVGKIKVQNEWCTSKLEGFWTERALKPGQGDYTALTFESDFTELLTKKLGEAKETALWQSTVGGSGNLGQFDGFNKIIADAVAVTINGNPTGITVATGITTGNVIGILDGMWALLPSKLTAKDDLQFMVGNDTFTKLIIALKNANMFHYNGVDGTPYQSGSIQLPGTGIRVEMYPGLDGTSKIHLGRTSNFVIGADLESDSDKFEIRENPITLSIMLDVHFKLGTQVKFPNEIVTFKLVP